MNFQNAKLLLELREVNKSLFAFKSPLSQLILLYIASRDGTCELHDLFETRYATTIAMRQHVQHLADAQLLKLVINETNRRAKRVHLTGRAWQLMRHYELQVLAIMQMWKTDISSEIPTVD